MQKKVEIIIYGFKYNKTEERRTIVKNELNNKKNGRIIDITKSFALVTPEIISLLFLEMCVIYG